MATGTPPPLPARSPAKDATESPQNAVTPPSKRRVPCQPIQEPSLPPRNVSASSKSLAAESPSPQNLSIGKLTPPRGSEEGRSPSKSSSFFARFRPSPTSHLNSRKKSADIVPEKEPTEPIFGVGLDTAVERSQQRGEFLNTKVPIVVTQCIQYLNEHGLGEVGLYRVPGSTAVVNHLKHRYDSGQEVAFHLDNDEDYDAHTVASLLKLFLRELKRPLIPPEASTRLRETVVRCNTKDVEHISREIQQVVREFPERVWELYRVICAHLSCVKNNSEQNKMSLSNLGLVFCPSLDIGSVVFNCFVLHGDICFRQDGILFDPETYQPAESHGPDDYVMRD